MYFILSKLLIVFVSPFAWAFYLLIYALVTKNQKKRYRIVMLSVAILYFFGIGFPVRLFAHVWDVPPHQPKSIKYSAVIVLGGFVSEREDGTGHFNDAEDRFIQATRLLANGTASHLLFTGGNADLFPDGFTEGAFVKNELKKLNFPDSVIIIESHARNTFENAAFSKKALVKANLKPPYLLVTSAYHMRRSLLIFKKAGLAVDAYPCDYMVSKGTVSLSEFLPGTDAFGKWNTYFKEIIGYVVAWFK
ncbi:YdcF family protein [Mucilaginibacter segetis]|uniref:YdcF family protein n=1 Tax=Mucilaginibacter segetis TaxID=2793071 RepID=A0A934PSB9_9SPHI|nr:YdcF family protein [Mucilaginibacter segetis]MBK0379893.1 YdcF family protein [Mucilaginibacter segetis]